MSCSKEKFLFSMFVVKALSIAHKTLSLDFVFNLILISCNCFYLFFFFVVVFRCRSNEGKKFIRFQSVFLHTVFVFFFFQFFVSGVCWERRKKSEVYDYATTDKAELNWKNVMRLNGTSLSCSAHSTSSLLERERVFRVYVYKCMFTYVRIWFVCFVYRSCAACECMGEQTVNQCCSYSITYIAEFVQTIHSLYNNHMAKQARLNKYTRRQANEWRDAGKGTKSTQTPNSCVCVCSGFLLVSFFWLLCTEIATAGTACEWWISCLRRNDDQLFFSCRLAPKPYSVEANFSCERIAAAKYCDRCLNVTRKFSPSHAVWCFLSVKQVFTMLSAMFGNTSGARRKNRPHQYIRGALAVN